MTRMRSKPPTTAWGRKLQAWMKRAGLTMHQAAEALDFSYDIIVRWRRGDNEPTDRNRRDVEAMMAGERPLWKTPANGRKRRRR